MAKLKSWKELAIGGIIPEGGTAEEYDTTGWRTVKPVVDLSRCTHCTLCWTYCPDSAVIFKDMKMVGFDYKHCKGCGICADVCPVKCITMERED